VKTISISASRSYEVRIGRGLLPEAGAAAKAATGASRVLLISDSGVWPHHGETVLQSLRAAGLTVKTFVFPRGEEQKNLATYGEALEAMGRARLTRKDAVIALGGGVVGDLAGFAAGTYQRGIQCVQIPTTLLAAVDSSVGGKTAVNLSAGKNQAGVFFQPSLVLCDTDALDTLAESEFRAGCGEVVKYAMIGSEELFRSLSTRHVSEHPEEIIARCVSMKRDYVQQDEFDTGARMMLNFGHTFGHAAEAVSGYEILHGEAVAMGMAAMTRAAAAFGCCSPEVSAALEELLIKLGLPTDLPYPAEALAKAALSDKKAGGDSLHIIVPEAIGRCRIETVAASDLPRWLRAGGAK